MPLGVSDAWMWSRWESKATGLETPTIKESDRWVEGYERVAEMAERRPQSRLVYVADREGDMLSLMAKSKALNTLADRLVRARHDRKLSAEETLLDSVDKQEVMSRISLIKPRKKVKNIGRFNKKLKCSVVLFHARENKVLRSLWFKLKK